MKQILLNSAKNNENVNVESSEYISLSTKQRSVPTENVEGMINHYELYLKERNECKNYKMMFTLHPYMTNVLFNPFTEIIYNEGAIGSKIIGGKQVTGINDFYNTINTETKNALNSSTFNSCDGDRRYQLIRDTENSHPELGNLAYHCGLDIFNNHYLRSKGFFSVKCSGNKKTFNTIEDVLIYSDNTIAKVKRETPNGNILGIKDVTMHLFTHENTDDIITAFRGGIKEENGWVGFYNRAYAPTVSQGYVINRCINNRQSCDFIDMYPDRTLFGFQPKINELYNDREEYNWKWFLTYPYENVYVTDKDKDFPFFNKNGLKIVWSSEPNERVSRSVYFRTLCKHNLQPNDLIKITCDLNGGIITSFSLRVLNVGDSKGNNGKYYFSVSYDDLADEYYENKGKIKLPTNMWVAKIKEGIPCVYYIRKFKKLQEVSSTLNKMAFSRTIFNDNVSQLMYNENINVDGLKDNLGRELSEIFLTIVKTNVGNKQFYLSGSSNPYYTEYSHCFGKITSGFNFEIGDKDRFKATLLSDRNMRDYNVRTLYNLEGLDGSLENFVNEMGIKYTPPTPLEDEITEKRDYFVGDFVEFSPNTMSEEVIEDVYHRFNTFQRENILNNDFFNFSHFKYDEIEFDDFDFGDGNFEAAKSENIANFTVAIKDNGFRNHKDENGVDKNLHDNIFPEGYFYKPHYRVKIKEYSDIISSDYDVKLLNVDGDNKVKQSQYWSRYYFEINEQYALTYEDKIVLCYENGKRYEYYVSDDTRGNVIGFVDMERGLDQINKGLKYIFYKNPNIPSYAIPVNNEGKYVWRELMKDTELPQDSDIYNRTYANGAVYVNTNINFYLRRQDPYGVYGLRYSSIDKETPRDFIINGVENGLPDVDYKIEKNYSVCEN